MARNFVQPGNVLTYINAGAAIVAGAVVPMGACVGVAQTDIAATTGTGAVAMSGVHTLPKVAGTAWVQGDRLSYDLSALAFQKGLSPVTGDITLVAYAAAAAASGDVVGAVALANPGVAN